MLNKWTKEKVFKPGVQFIARTPGKRAPLWWNLDKCREALQQYSAERVEVYEID